MVVDILKFWNCSSSIYLVLLSRVIHGQRREVESSWFKKTVRNRVRSWKKWIRLTEMRERDWNWLILSSNLITSTYFTRQRIYQCKVHSTIKNQNIRNFSIFSEVKLPSTLNYIKIKNLRKSYKKLIHTCITRKFYLNTNKI